MVWDVEYTDEFEAWWIDKLDNAERESVAAYVALLEESGPALAHPYSSAIRGLRYSHLRELRIQHKGRPYRVLYANHLEQLMKEGLIDGKEVS